MDFNKLVVISLFLCLTVSAQSQNCSLNEVYVTSRPVCPRTCQNRNRPLCDSIIVSAGCVCKSGYIREGPGGPCVPDSCDGAVICSKNEVYSTCSKNCPETCHVTEPRACILICRTGCDCADGFIRSNKTGDCIPVDDCKYECDKTEVYKKCGSKYPATCSQLTQSYQKDCRAGCFCGKEYILEDKTGRCVKATECSKYQKTIN